MLAPMPASVIFGIGPKAAERLGAIGVRTIADLLALGEPGLAQRFGREAAALWTRLAQGLDERPVRSGAAAKSIGRERTFAENLSGIEILRPILLDHVETVARSLREDGLRTRRITLKCRTGDFETFTRAATLDEPTDDTALIWEAASGLLDRWLSERHPPLRLLGVSLHDLASHQQMGLFTDGLAEGSISTREAAKAKGVDAVADRIVQRFGTGAIKRAGAMDAREKIYSRSPNRSLQRGGNDAKPPTKMLGAPSHDGSPWGEAPARDE